MVGLVRLRKLVPPYTLLIFFLLSCFSCISWFALGDLSIPLGHDIDL